MDSDGTAGFANVAYRSNWLRSYSPLVPAVHASIGADSHVEGVTASLGGSAVLFLPFATGVGVRGEALVWLGDDPVFAAAAGLEILPYRMTPDKWGDLTVVLRGVFPLNDREDNGDRIEALVTLYFNLTNS